VGEWLFKPCEQRTVNAIYLFRPSWAYKFAPQPCARFVLYHSIFRAGRIAHAGAMGPNLGIFSIFVHCRNMHKRPAGSDSVENAIMHRSVSLSTVPLVVHRPAGSLTATNQCRWRGLARAEFYSPCSFNARRLALHALLGPITETQSSFDC
jgi:hypothetical protein